MVDFLDLDNTEQSYYTVRLGQNPAKLLDGPTWTESSKVTRWSDLDKTHPTLSTLSPSEAAALCKATLPQTGRVLFPISTKLATGLRSIARNNKATRLLTRPG